MVCVCHILCLNIFIQFLFYDIFNYITLPSVLWMSSCCYGLYILNICHLLFVPASSILWYHTFTFFLFQALVHCPSLLVAALSYIDCRFLHSILISSCATDNEYHSNKCTLHVFSWATSTLQFLFLLHCWRSIILPFMRKLSLFISVHWYSLTSVNNFNAFLFAKKQSIIELQSPHDQV